MRCDENVSLKLDEEVLIFIHNRLREFGLEHPNCKFEINYWIDDLVTKSVQEIYDYLITRNTKKLIFIVKSLHICKKSSNFAAQNMGL